MRSLFVLIALAGVVAPFYLQSAGAAGPDPLVARGRYLVVAAACNDCHTPHWRDSGGNVPVGNWMVGNSIGLRENWGTDYPANVRLLFAHMTESEWLFEVHTRGGRMQWHDLRRLTLDDQRSIFRFIRALGPKGTQAPDSLPADRQPNTPYIDLRLHTPRP